MPTKWFDRKKPKKNKILYFRFAKCAGTFLSHYFDRHYPDLVTTILHVKPQRKEWCQQDFANSFGDHYIFSLVRNPWAWQLSLYFHYRQSWQNLNRELFCEEFPSFEDWLKNRNRHTPQKYGSQFCWENELFDNINYYNGLFLPDYVGKVETLSENIHNILLANRVEIRYPLDQFKQENEENNFISEHKKMQNNVANATKHDHYLSYYTNELIDLVSYHNRSIIEQYGYTFDDLVPSNTSAQLRIE